MLGLLESMYGTVTSDLRRIEVADLDGETPELSAELDGRSKILIVTLGLVSGGTLQELFVRTSGARGASEGRDFELCGFVLHARPRTFREWQSVRSSFYRKVVAGWITYLPSSHPFLDEQTLLRDSARPLELSPAARQYEQRRRTWVVNSTQANWLTRRSTWNPASGNPNPAAVLLCAAPERSSPALPRLLPGSRFGHQMSMIGTLAGVGTTLHRARLDRELQGGPAGLRFDLTRVPVVYFEAPIISAVLRWIGSSEAYWEFSGRSAEDVIRECWYRSRNEQPGNQGLLLAELLLAAASGKLPRHCKPLLKELEAEMREQLSEADFAPIELAAHLLDAEWPEVDPKPSTSSTVTGD